MWIDVSYTDSESVDDEEFFLEKLCAAHHDHNFMVQAMKFSGEFLSDRALFGPALKTNDLSYGPGSNMVTTRAKSRARGHYESIFMVKNHLRGKEERNLKHI